jgi:hypothetical protein
MGTICFRNVLHLVVLLFLLSGLSAWAAEELNYLYQWKDDRGVVNMTDSLDKVPPKYRSRATRLLQPGSGKKVQRSEEPSEKEQLQDLDAGTVLDQDDIKKAEWQQRMQDAKRRLADAVERSRQIEQRRNDLAARVGSLGASLPSQNILNEIESLDGELVRAKMDADRARNEVEVTIPDEARRASIPPGWLREVQ